MSRRFALILIGIALAGGAALIVLSGRSDRAAEQATVDPLFDPDIDMEPEAPDQAQPTFPASAGSFLTKHCASCHAGERPKGGIAIAFADEASALANRATLSKAAAAVRSGRMPPPGRPRPEQAEAKAFLAWADRIAAGPPNPGRVTLRRLNRAEYDNTIRDLVGVAFRPAADFPADDSGDGFDTNADVLSVSPLLIEKYLAAAETIIEAAANDAGLWRRLSTPPAEDFIPFVLRGTPPQRDNAIKGTLPEQIDERSAARAAEIDRAYLALQSFADRAYRRPITHAEMQRLMRFVETAITNGEGADAGLKLALTAVLVSPHFLFRVERDSPGQGPDRLLTDFELATRLSYFLWSSMPDDELFRLAVNSKLHDPPILVWQVRRMLKDPKSRALAENFAGQWLQTRALTEVTRDALRFPGFDTNLRDAMRQETELFFDHVVREDKRVLDLLSGDYTFVNEQLARHYGIADVTGADFRRVSLVGTGRAGVLTHASVLTVTSGPTRTSPVKRGKWVLESILGIPQPPPPPGADTLKDGEGRAATVREQLARHRSRAECASCHARLDPLGFGLENFDAIGAWRDRDGDTPVDASGTLPDGRAFRGSQELLAALAERPNDFTRSFTEKLLTYALGRSLGPGDRFAVDRIVRHAAGNGYRFSSLVIALVRSDPFQKRRVYSEDMP